MLEARHQSDVSAVTASQIEKANNEGASTRAEMEGVQADIETCKTQLQQQVATMTSATTRLASVDRAAAFAGADAETLRSQIEAYKQVLQQQQTTAARNMTEDFKRQAMELQQARRALWK